MDNYNIIEKLLAENARLKTENSRLDDDNRRLNSDVAKLNNDLAELKVLNNWYLEQFRLAQHYRFGKSSEKTTSGQLSLFNEAEAIADPKLPEPDLAETVTKVRKKKTKGRREAFYNGIPTEQIVHELPDNEQTCFTCNNNLHACGREVLRRELKIIPAQVSIVEHVQTVYSCRNCEQTSDADTLALKKAIVLAPVIAGSGIASPSLVSFILCNKFVLALPLYRQAQELERSGIHISRQTMANWAMYVAAKWLTPIYNLLKVALLGSDILHADETTTQVIKEPEHKTQRKSFMWMYHTGKHSDCQVALFEYRPTRVGTHPLNFLEGFSGFLHVDAYTGYKKLEEQDITLVECWAHVRRRFDKSLKALDKSERVTARANIGLEYCNRLFGLERKYDELNLSFEERKDRRVLEATPIAEEFFAWAQTIIDDPKVPSKSTFGDAVRYAINQKKWLLNYMLDGRLEMSNNRAEASIRPFTIGRKNWLFSFSSKGATASAIIYSIVETAKLNGLVPFLYLEHLFEVLPNIPQEQFAEYLPWADGVQKVCRLRGFADGAADGLSSVSI